MTTYEEERDPIAKLELLEQENRSLRGSTKRMGEDHQKAQRQARKMQRQIDQLMTENDFLRKDAKRYRWLRKQPDCCIPNSLNVNRWNRNGLAYRVHGKKLDGLIDQAMNGEQP